MCSMNLRLMRSSVSISRCLFESSELPSRWVNKRAKFDASDLDEAALKSDDDSGGPE